MQREPCPRQEVDAWTVEDDVILQVLHLVAFFPVSPGDPHSYFLPLEYASWRSQVHTAYVGTLLSCCDQGDCRRRLSYSL
ncbi:hypothetical protein H5410_049557 [Solanum commersonii]|uniref:Uncharacterized protein n=1 Tax=Solanum commersonii TaxID=4109 RepID=A0A9J5WT92_SOLCO|nr:hypothetical protein H5410_049557 [Solanum commersonii]